MQKYFKMLFGTAVRRCHHVCGRGTKFVQSGKTIHRVARRWAASTFVHISQFFPGTAVTEKMPVIKF